tara:strand:- start:170 stop:322 length:153 start_codon:yes stop_codon:yes gene_type:complete
VLDEPLEVVLGAELPVLDAPEEVVLGAELPELPLKLPEKLWLWFPAELPP